MKYNPPQVEDYETDDVTTTSKRKRDAEETPTMQEDNTDDADTQPPSKATRSRGDAGNGEEDKELLEEEGEFDEGDLDEDLSQEGEDDESDEEVDSAQAEAQPEKKDTSQKKKTRESPSSEKLQKTIEMYGRGPLEGTAIEEEALSGSSGTILAMLIDAMLKSKPMSHELTDRTLRSLVDAGYHDIKKLGDASWEQRAMALKDGGYNRYREQGSTNLGKLVEFLNEKYGAHSHLVLFKSFRALS